jgi:hypothetical protein
VTFRLSNPACVVPSAPTVRVTVFAALIASSVVAQPIGTLQPEQKVFARAMVSGGVVTRQASTAFGPDLSAKLANGFVGPVTSLSGSLFFRDWFGLALDVQADLVGASSKDLGLALVRQDVGRGALTGIVRFQPSLLFGLEGRVGLFGGRHAWLRPDAANPSGSTAIGGLSLDRKSVV